jgi:hypothetical protein
MVCHSKHAAERLMAIRAVVVCSVESDTRKPCYGKERIVDLTDIERWSAGAETQPPSMLERSSSVLSTASDYAGSQAGKFAHAVKAAWTCAKTLFKNCGS